MSMSGIPQFFVVANHVSKNHGRFKAVKSSWLGKLLCKIASFCCFNSMLERKNNECNICGKCEFPNETTPFFGDFDLCIHCVYQHNLVSGTWSSKLSHSAWPTPAGEETHGMFANKLRLEKEMAVLHQAAIILCIDILYIYIYIRIYK